MKKATLFLLLIIAGMVAHAQAEPDYHYFIESKYKRETYGIGSSSLAQQLTYIGLYKESLMEEERYSDKVQLKSNLVPSNLHAENAYPYIFQAIKENRIVMLNETHNNPLSRVLLYNIIDSLEKFDVKAIFIEALGYDTTDSSFVSSKQPFAKGIYTSENIFRQVMYKFKNLNVRLYSYEYQPKDLDTMTIQGDVYIVSKNDEKWVPIKADQYILFNFLSKDDFFQRDAHQALKIFQKLQREHIDKAFIYCGYGHAWRMTARMIDILEYLLKENVFSIDQTSMNECANKTLETPSYKKFATANYPFVVVDEKKQPYFPYALYNGDRYATKPIYDLMVSSPRSVYINNRPTWLELNGDRKRYHLSQFMELNEQKDFLVAFYTLDELKTEKEEYIPDDVFQVFGTGYNYDVILKPNQPYQLRVIKDKKIIINKTVYAD